MTNTTKPVKRERTKDLSGQRFGRWIVLDRAGSTAGNANWMCRCDCGTESVLSGGNLRRGHSLSCGCLQTDRKHRRSAPEYVCWCRMRDRCNNPNGVGYKNYGGRGISICKEWGVFETFLADMGVRPSPLHSIERKNTDGNYEPNNCIWATRVTQNNNRRNNRLITIGGVTKTVAEWGREPGAVSISAIRMRLTLGWTSRNAVFAPAVRGISRKQRGL